VSELVLLAVAPRSLLLAPQPSVREHPSLVKRYHSTPERSAVRVLRRRRLVSQYRTDAALLLMRIRSAHH
jgi:hypothetical protein